MAFIYAKLFRPFGKTSVSAEGMLLSEAVEEQMVETYMAIKLMLLQYRWKLYLDKFYDRLRKKYLK